MDTTLNHRARAILRAVAAGRAEVTCSRMPDLFIDGVACCDQFTVHTLATAGLLRHARPGAVGTRVPAVLTPVGLSALGAASAAA